MLRRRVVSLLTLLFIALLIPTAQADDIRHTFAGNDLNSFYIDDRGGSVNNGGSDNSYYLNLYDIDQSVFGTLFLYSSSGGEPVVEDGLVDEDFGSPSGINLYNLSVLPGTSSAGEIGLASDSPLTPVSYLGAQSGLLVEQVSYTNATPGSNYAIVEYRVVNPTASDVQARMALSNDFDVDLKSDDARVGYDDSVYPMVFQQEAAPLDPNHTSVGVALLKGQEAQYRLEVCTGAFGVCNIFADDDDFIRQAFFEGVNGQVGDLTDQVPNQDFAVTIAADLGTIPSGEAVSVVFCYNLAQGDDLDAGLINLLLGSGDCNDFYEDEIQTCGNGLVNYGEVCDDGDEDQSDSCPDGETGSCDIASCGDGFIWTTDGGSEVCDDGNESVNDRCPSGPTGTCLDAECGDGFVWNTDGGTEECDNGIANSNTTPDACRENCVNPACGDSVTDTGEGCDDGNGSNNDSCLTSCEVAGCGDGYIWNTDGGTEECDDGAANSNTTPDACRTNCVEAGCGDSVTDSGEQCDDGNDSNRDSCLNSCLNATCGDGFVRVGAEVCDDGNNINGDGCSADCQSFESCGNGVLDPNESCDDGNTNTSDSCPDGNRGICQPASCGDGYLWNLDGGTEECDDGNNIGGDGCSPDCRDEGSGFIDPSQNLPPAVCGNGIVEAGERCDDGNTNNNDTCNNECSGAILIQGGGTSDNSKSSGGCSLGGTSGPAGTWLGLFLVLTLLMVRHRQRLS